MKTRHSSLSALLAALLMQVTAPAAESANLYRYTNDEGNVVVDYQVPTKYVAQGYEVLNMEGVILEVVPRQLTDEEKQVLNAQQELEVAARAEQERLREWDESLLLRYSTIADIEAAEERALRDLRIRMSILKGNKRSLKQQVENYQAQAADLERRGQKVDVARLVAIEDIQAEIESTDRSINERALEIEEVEQAYQRDKDRFRMLLEVVELRKTLLAKQQEERNKEKRSDPRR
jgi:chromosome segregation ATPase